MKNAAAYYGKGIVDGRANAPRAKGLKGDNKAAYENGYREGQQARTREGTWAKQKKFA